MTVPSKLLATPGNPLKTAKNGLGGLQGSGGAQKFPKGGSINSRNLFRLDITPKGPLSITIPLKPPPISGNTLKIDVDS